VPTSGTEPRQERMTDLRPRTPSALSKDAFRLALRRAVRQLSSRTFLANAFAASLACSLVCISSLSRRLGSSSQWKYLDGRRPIIGPR